MDDYGKVWVKLRDSSDGVIKVLLPDIASEVKYFKSRIVIRRRKDTVLPLDLHNNYKLEFILHPRPNPDKPQVILEIRLRKFPVITRGDLL